MTVTIQQWSRASFVSCVVLLAACGSTGSAPPRLAQRVQILPARAQTYFLFGDGSVVERAGSREVVTEFQAPPGLGLPLASGVDLNGEYGVVTYRDRIAWVKLSEQDVAFNDAPWSQAPRGVSVNRSLALALSDGALTWVWRDEKREAPRADLAPFLDRHGLGPVHCAALLSETQFVLVTHAGHAARCVRVDRGGSTWTVVADQVVDDLDELHATASDGTGLYLAGIQHQMERTGVGPGLNARDRVFLVVQRLDYGRFDSRTIVRRELDVTNWRVTGLAAGLDLLMIVLADGTLLVQRILPGGISTAPVLERRFEPGIQAAWLAGKRIAVADPAGRDVRILEDLAGNP